MFCITFPFYRKKSVPYYRLNHFVNSNNNTALLFLSTTKNVIPILLLIELHSVKNRAQPWFEIIPVMAKKII